MSTVDDELFELMETRIEPSQTDDDLADETLVEYMTGRIEELMATQFESLMSMMYRLDVDEGKIRRALNPTNPENPAKGLARLIVLRQKQRMATREKYKQNSPDDWIDIE